jgi:excisionase family DNA binding protein
VRVTCWKMALFSNTVEVFPVPRVVTLVSWAFAPEWLTVQEASELSGHNTDTLHWLIQDGALDTRRMGDTWLVEKASLREFQEALLEVLH